MGVGYPGAGIDFRVYPTGVTRGKFIWNLGLRSTLLFPKEATTIWMYSLPIGFSYFGSSKINYELDLGPMVKFAYDQGVPITGISSTLNYVWFSVKVGRRFSLYAMKRARELNRLEKSNGM